MYVLIQKTFAGKTFNKQEANSYYKFKFMHLNSELLFKKYAVSYFKKGMKILEIGPAGHPSAYQKIVDNPLITWHTLDFESTTYINSSSDSLTYKLTTPYDFPVDDDQYDIVVSGQVIEHVEKIWLWIRELKRVIKKNGIIITINPVSWPYHEAPLDCWRIFPDGMKALADDAGLEVRMSLFESAEKDQILKKDPQSTFIPGQSYTYGNPVKNISSLLRWNKLIRKVPVLNRHFQIPIEVSYDTISVLKK